MRERSFYVVWRAVKTPCEGGTEIFGQYDVVAQPSARRL